MEKKTFKGSLLFIYWIGEKSDGIFWWGFLFTYLGTSYYFRFLKNISCDKYVNF